MDKRPNVIYLHTHDAGRFIQPYGYSFETPNLMKLALGGTTFRNAHCVAPSCSPSRAALLTGEYTHTNGMFGLASRCSGWKLRDYQHHMCHTFRANGYETVLAGVQHLAKMPLSDRDWLGYDRHLNPLPKECHDDFECMTTDVKAAEFIKEKHDKPFFLSVGFLEPHRAGATKDNFIKHRLTDDNPDDRYERPLPLYPDCPTTRRESALFRQGVQRVDAQFGKVYDAVEEAGLIENTIIVCTTDHGVGFPKMKCTLSDWGTGVFLIITGPGFRKGAVSDGLVSHIDVFPTLCDALGFEKPTWLQGESFLPILQGKTTKGREYLFTEQNYHGSWKPLRAVCDGRYKLVQSFLEGADETRFTTDAGPTHKMLEDCPHGMKERIVPQYQLFDRYFDPIEVCNVADKPEYREEFLRLQQQLQKWMQETGDPILTDEIPKEEPDKGFKHYHVDMNLGYDVMI